MAVEKALMLISCINIPLNISKNVIRKNPEKNYIPLQKKNTSQYHFPFPGCLWSGQSINKATTKTFSGKKSREYFPWNIYLGLDVRRY